MEGLESYITKTLIPAALCAAADFLHAMKSRHLRFHWDFVKVHRVNPITISLEVSRNLYFIPEPASLYVKFEHGFFSVNGNTL